MTRPLDRGEVAEALAVDLVLDRYGIIGRWAGRWMRARRCAAADHATLAFGASRDGKWHCHACNTGGDLFALIAAGEGLDHRKDFAAVLAIAAAIAGVTGDAPAGMAPGYKIARRRQQAPVEADLATRVATSRKRAAWAWDRLQPTSRAGALYLRDRGFDPDKVRLGAPGADVDGMPHLVAVEVVRFTPIFLETSEAKSDAARSLRKSFQIPSVCIPVRHVEDGALVNVMARRLEPQVDQPKIVGLPGCLSHSAGELIGCYGFPHLAGLTRAELGEGEGRDIVVVEGWADYLAARFIWGIDADVLGAVDAGQIEMVCGFAAARAAESGGRVILIGQDDPPRRDGTAGAAARATEAGHARMLMRLPIARALYVPCKPWKDLAIMFLERGAIEIQERLERVAAASIQLLGDDDPF